MIGKFLHSLVGKFIKCAMNKQGYNREIALHNLNQMIAFYKRDDVVTTEEISDGFHTFKELYDTRKALTVALFNTCHHTYFADVHKSRKHHDGTYPFNDPNWFIVCAKSRCTDKVISFHYHIDDWDSFRIKETEKSIYPYDGHTTQDVIDRLLQFDVVNFSI